MLMVNTICYKQKACAGATLIARCGEDGLFFSDGTTELNPSFKHTLYVHNGKMFGYQQF